MCEAALSLRAGEAKEVEVHAHRGGSGQGERLPPLLLLLNNSAAGECRQRQGGIAEATSQTVGHQQFGRQVVVLQANRPTEGSASQLGNHGLVGPERESEDSQKFYLEERREAEDAV